MTTLGRRCCASICANKCTSAGDVQHVSTPTWGLGPKDLNTITGQNQNYLVFQTICWWIKAREVSGFLMCRIPCWRMLKATATSKKNHGNIDWMVVAIRICPPHALPQCIFWWHGSGNALRTQCHQNMGCLKIGDARIVGIVKLRCINPICVMVKTWYMSYGHPAIIQPMMGILIMTYSNWWFQPPEK